ncbi:MAG TPA: DUF983 domain-containing protein [Mucilaginibacter sp.]|jgi:uncharacterized protein (DUF983 family)
MNTETGKVISLAEKQKKHGYIWTLFNQKCPNCREGSMYQGRNPLHLKSYLKMHESCPVCGQRTEIEIGFYYGTAYVSYAITVAFSAFTFVAWWVLIGFSLKDNRFFWWMGINAGIMLLLQPYFMRFSRAMWLSFFVKYDQYWRLKKEAPTV